MDIGDRGAERTGKPAARLVPWSPTASSEEMRSYVQERLALFSKLMFWIFWILIGFVQGLYEVHPELRPERVAVVNYLAFGGLVLLAAIWHFGLRRGKPSLRGLYFIDGLYAFVIGLTFGFSAYFSTDQRAAVWSAFIWHTFVVFSRVIMLPSSGRRTAIVTGVSYVPLLVAGFGMTVFYPETIELPPVAFVFGDALFIAIAVLLATTGSRVIYGLRQQVNEAMQLGQYTLDEKIGAGGMGEVYRARHAMLRRPTAIKLLAPDRYRAEDLKRFEREVQNMSRLTHPNSVAVYDYGRSPAGVFYYAMELLDGIDLESLVGQDGPQSAPRVAHILHQVCGALDEAHFLGLIHRDVKPANIILCRRGRMPDVAKVVDFGLVKEIAPASRDTQTQVIMGTPSYLAPEAITDPDQVGARSDLYSLGAVGYYLLTGQRLFEGKTAVDVCLQHVSSPPVPPSDRVSFEIPADLEGLIMRCLAKQPDQRPDSAAALRADIGHLHSYVAWDETRASAWWDRFESAQTKSPPAGHRPGPITMTVDVHARTATSRLDHEDLTGHAR